MAEAQISYSSLTGPLFIRSFKIRFNKGRISFPGLLNIYGIVFYNVGLSVESLD